LLYFRYVVYGPDGKRKNTRAVRWRERYTTDRQDILEKLLQLNPNTRKSSNIFFRKRSKKIRIPVEKHPTYNFIGLIIGPRGKTQKELESKTGCKIAIRGRGSVKEGARGRRDGQVMQGDTDPLHVVITGDDQASVDAASSMIEQMLIVIDDEKNVHKQQQLRELALLNGTLKDEDIFCSICAEKGHRSFECPKQFTAAGASRNKGLLQVKCAICGDTSHPTRDCRQQKPVVTAADGSSSQAKDQGEIDSDYLSFMAEIEGKKVETTSSATTVAGVGDVTIPTSLPPPPNVSGLPPPPRIDGILPPVGAPHLLPPPPSSSQLPAPPSTSIGFPFPPSTQLPPPPIGMPPPPPPLTGGVQPPQLHPPLQSLPPGIPPSLLPPPGGGQQYPPNNNYYTNQHDNRSLPHLSHSVNVNNEYQQQQQYQRSHHDGGGYGGGAYQQQQAGHFPHQQQQQAHQDQQNSYQQQVRPGEETSAWDPNAYYGSGGGGELNWWEQ
jgi:splicing factor 1